MPQDTTSQFIGGPVEVYELNDMVQNMLLSIVLGLVVALVYRQTHKGLSYSQSFTITVVLVTVVVAMVMMVIGNSLSRAFALVGALSIIRFRTVVKDTKDTAFVFWGLSVGIASGTGEWELALIGTGLISLLCFALHKSNFGALYKSEFILRFRFSRDSDSAAYLETINQHARTSNMLHLEPSGDGASLQLTYDIVLKDGHSAEDLTTGLSTLEGLSEVLLIASKNDVDY